MVPKYNNVFSNIGALGIYNMPGAYTSLHGHPEWFSSDGNHPNGAGQQAIANNVIAHLLSNPLSCWTRLYWNCEVSD